MATIKLDQDWYEWLWPSATLDREVSMAKTAVRDFIDVLAERHKLEIRIRSAAYRSKLKGRSFNRSLGQLKRWAKR